MRALRRRDRDTQYGAIKVAEQVKYVVRKPLDANFTDVQHIVDKEVRAKVEQAIAEYGSLAKALEAGSIWMNKEKMKDISVQLI